MSKQKISPTGAWLFQGGHMFDAKLAETIDILLKDPLQGMGMIDTILDIGCGDGSYTRFLIDCGFQMQGYDGNPDTGLITGGLGRVADFSRKQHLGLFDAVLCLEVGEHIPAEYEQIFLDNVTRHAERMIVMSWAVPGQGGHGHINERPNSWVIDEMDERGWMYDQSASDHLRANISNCYWFSDTIMVFRPE